MEFYQHFITADIKYNFWCVESGHQFREDWVKCRFNINYIDEPYIEIKCYAANPHVEVPLGTVINFNDFHFERAEEVDGIKKNIYLITWTPQVTEHNKFYVAIDDRVQYENYGTYLSNMIKICRIAQDERSEEYMDDYSSTSFFDVTSSSLSLFSISAYNILDRSLAAEMAQAKKKCTKGRFRGISRVKNATKSVAKKVNRILTKAKTKLKKPTTKRTSAISDAHDDIGTIHNDGVDNDNLEDLDLNKTSTSSLHFIESSPFAVDECEWQIAEDYGSGESDSCMDSCENCSSSIQLNPTLDQSTCDKSSYGSLDSECISSAETVSLVSLIINRAQSRSPILFRPDFYVKKTTRPRIPNADGSHHHQHHALYQVSNDYYSSIDDHTHLSERINAKHPIESNGIDSNDLIGKNTKNVKTSRRIIAKFATPSNYCKKISTNIYNVTQKFLKYVSTVQ